MLLTQFLCQHQAKNVYSWAMHQQIKCTLIRQLIQKLSDQGILYLQKTIQGVTRAECVKEISRDLNLLNNVLFFSEHSLTRLEVLG